MRHMDKELQSVLIKRTMHPLTPQIERDRPDDQGSSLGIFIRITSFVVLEPDESTQVENIRLSDDSANDH